MAKHLLPASGIRHGNAARTGWDASPYRWTPFERCFALAPLRSANPCACRFSWYFCRSRSPPAPSIAAQHLRASWRNSVAARPVLDLDVQTFGAGCFGAGVCRKKRQRLTVRVAIARARFELELMKLALRTTKTKRPRSGIRGRSRSSEIGATDLLRRGSVLDAEIFPVVQSCAAEPLRARCRIAPEARGFGWGGDAVGGFHG